MPSQCAASETQIERSCSASAWRAVVLAPVAPGILAVDAHDGVQVGAVIARTSQPWAWRFLVVALVAPEVDFVPRAFAGFDGQRAVAVGVQMVLADAALEHQVGRQLEAQAGQPAEHVAARPVRQRADLAGAMAAAPAQQGLEQRAADAATAVFQAQAHELDAQRRCAAAELPLASRPSR